MVQSRRLEFVQLHQEYEKKLQDLEGRYNQISTFRILSFLAGGALLAIGLSDDKTVFTILGALLLGMFLFFVRQHGIVVKQQELAQSKCEVYKRYVDRFGDGWRQFEDAGADLLKKDDSVAADIDLLGPNSLYQMISVCHTDAGRQMLGKHLHERYMEPEVIKARQEAVEDLAGKREFAVDFEAASVRLNRNKRRLNVEAFEAYCKDARAGVLPGFANVLRILLPALELVALVLWIAGVTHYGYFLGGFVLLLAYSWLTTTVTGRVIQPVTAADSVIGAYEEMLSLISNTEFEAACLRQMQERASGDRGASKAFGRLHGIAQAYNISFNPLIHQLLSGLFLWDFQVAARVSKWKETFGDNVAGCFTMLGEMEELLSLSVLSVVRETSMPEVDFDSGQQVYLQAENLRHPLIQPEQVKGNPAGLHAGITIITGSNMSGKTTYLRTLGVNLVLAYIGGPVCGDRLRASYMKLFTSMRVTDDVAHGISTFYAEILRIKAMAEYRKNNAPMLCLVDEIFKGTNSADRIVGAREVITGLAGQQSMVVVSTHDFELCNLKDKEGKKAINYHFEEYYEDDELRFDYTIKNGRCTSTNARAILKMAGFSVEDA